MHLIYISYICVKYMNKCSFTLQWCVDDDEAQWNISYISLSHPLDLQHIYLGNLSTCIRGAGSHSNNKGSFHGFKAATFIVAIAEVGVLYFL